jgi:60 kDa SS-A/Ro ribonucleoprotein
MAHLRVRTNPYTAFRTRSNLNTPQTQPIPGKEDLMAPNNAGGYSFVLDSWKQLDRFLVLGSEGGTYYVGERELTRQNAKNIQKLIAEDGVRVVNRVVELSESGRLPKADPALFVLALAIAEGDNRTKAAVQANLSKVARIGTHLFTFVQYTTQFRGWGRVLRDAVSNWYTEKDANKLAYQAIKYQQRNGWSHRDLLRLSHAKTINPELGEIFHWIVKGLDRTISGDSQALRQIWAFEQAKKSSTTYEIVRLITEHDLPRECIPTEFLKDKAVWAALLERMPMTAMIRNLATMSRVGLLVPYSEAAKHIAKELTNVERIRKARIHPIQVLSALRVYTSGSGYHSRGADFTPVSKVSDALEQAFYIAFGNVEPTDKRILLGFDVSGSMSAGEIAGVPGLTPLEAQACMGLVTAKVEQDYHALTFDTSIQDFPLRSTDNLDSVREKMAKYNTGSGTDCSLAMQTAIDRNMPVDAFVIYTDSETWAGYEGHPAEVLNKYRNKTGIPAKLVVVGLTATDVSIADPTDAGMLDVAGFDSAAPGLISSFIRGEI